MSGDKVRIAELCGYDHILIYGAGAVGTRLLRALMVLGLAPEKVTAWDRNADKIGERFGYAVETPNFDRAQYFSDGAWLVIIALSAEENAELIREVRRKFEGSGCRNVIVFDDIDFAVQVCSEDEFINHISDDLQYQNDMDFARFAPKVKPIAYYLPQFHEIPENNEWWGKGFTEWVNTSKARPRFEGHYQPREPHDDLGYYDLSDVETIRKQAEMAKKHGIYGWCMYYYWFSGRTLLTKPIDLLLEHRDIDINYCLQWCNESWTKSWVGDERQELVRCEYREDDPEKFIDEIQKYMRDERYIRIDGKPLLILYRVHAVPDVRDTVRRWRKRACEVGVGEICVFSCVHPYSQRDLGLTDCFDGETDFSPAKYASDTIRLTDVQGKVISNHASGYAECLSSFKKAAEMGDHTAYLSCMAGWDNTPRYKAGYLIYDLDFSLKDYYDMARFVTDEALAHGREHIFYFAWNEWAEGAYLEPDKKYGYALLNTFSKAICGLPLDWEEEET